jgi:hypothetical protein
MGTGKGGNVLDVRLPVRLIRIIDIGTHAISYFRFLTNLRGIRPVEILSERRLNPGAFLEELERLRVPKF